ncbi:hypothetical protein [Halobacillus kuroshimensis]|nr:hypothetical protein [Halobacillus kuroshimensis]
MSNKHKRLRWLNHCGFVSERTTITAIERMFFRLKREDTGSVIQPAAEG